MLVHLYKQTLDQPNIIYMIQNIKQKDFQKHKLLVLQTEQILDIVKTIICVDKIKDEIKILQYLPSLLLELLHQKKPNY